MGNGQSNHANGAEAGSIQQTQQRYSPTSFGRPEGEQNRQQQQPNNSHSPHTSPGVAPHALHGSPHTGQQHQQQGRLLVDIRGANLDRESFAVWVERQPARRQRAAAAETMEGSVMLLSSTVQALGGILVTVLTISKLMEELKFIRGLRRNNNSRPGTSGSSRSGKNSTAAAGASSESSDPQHLGLPHNLVEQLHRCTPKAGLANRNGSSHGPAVTDNRTSKQSAWSSVAGLQNVKMLLQEVTVLPLLRPDLFCGVRAPPTAVLLYGPPGTGKTLLAKAVAAASGASFFPVTGSSVLSKWYGESEQNVRRLFEEAAAAAPSVIFIDEVDSLLAKRSGASADAPGGAGEASRRVTNEFLAYIDGIASSHFSNSSNAAVGGDSLQQCHSSAAAGRVVVIAATNAPWDLDEAALSRFSARLMVPLPDTAARQAILQSAMVGVPAVMHDPDFKQVAEQAEGLSGRDLVAVCREASMRPMRELFGNKVLEGQAPRHCQQQQLIAAVTRALQQGGSSRKLRRGLERWKRQNGAATDWCDVGEIIAAGEQGARRSQSMEQQQQQALQLQPCAHKQQSSGVFERPPQPSEQQPMTKLQHAEGCWCGAKPAPEQHSSRAPCNMHQQQQLGHSCQADGSQSMPDGEAAAQAAGSIVPEQSAPWQTCGSCEATRAVLSSHPIAFIEATDSSTPHRERCDNADSKRNEADSTAAEAVDVVPSCKVAAAHAAGEAAGSSRPVASACTLEELIALPADAVRPVTVDDLLAALKQVGSVDSSTRYEEWARQFGSGPGEGARRGEAWKWMPMYT